MRRRLFISGAVTAVVGLSGCAGDNTATPATGTDDTGPESTEEALIAVLETHWDAYGDRDVERYVSTLHSESPQRDGEPWNDEGYWGAEDSTFTIESRDVVEVGETTATVNEIIRGEVDGNTNRWRGIVELRTEDGEWKVWDWEEEPIEEDG